MPVYRLSNDSGFPPVEEAVDEGLLAVGGDLSIERLVLAYSSGIFPWYSEGQPILWWSPDPRFVLFPENLKVSRTMARLIKQGRFTVTFDAAFDRVIHHCRRVPRAGQDSTWIVPEMLGAYHALHEAGYAHSVEVWQDDELAGGLYGVSLGRCFFGESMFSLVSNASKVGFVTLVKRLVEEEFSLIDCQVPTDHLHSLGAEAIPRTQFMELLEKALQAGDPSVTGNRQVRG